MNSIRFPNVSSAPMSRRSLFRGVGVTLALLLLDAMSPAILRACPEIEDVHTVSGKALAAGIVLATFRHVSPAASASRLTISGHALTAAGAEGKLAIPFRLKKIAKIPMNGARIKGKMAIVKRMRNETEESFLCVGGGSHLFLRIALHSPAVSDRWKLAIGAWVTSTNGSV